VSFEGDIKSFGLKLNGASDRMIKGVEIALFSDVIQDTPVDEGRLVGNWQVTFGQPSTGTVEGVDPGRSGTIGKMTTVVNSKKGGRVTWMTNNLPYAVPIEYGGSKGKAPQGMVRKNITRFAKLVKEQESKTRI